jgi:hypothetical protein
MYPAISTVNNFSEYRQDLKGVLVDQFVPFLQYGHSSMRTLMRFGQTLLDWCIVQQPNLTATMRR